MPSEPKIDDLAVARRVVTTAARVTRVGNDLLGKLEIPLTYRQHRLLIRIAEGHSSMGELTRLASLTFPTVSESVAGLVRRGLITRRTSTDDRRLTVLELTPLGDKALLAGNEALDAVLLGLIAGVPATRRPALERALATVFQAATDYFSGRAEAGKQAAK